MREGNSIRPIFYGYERLCVGGSREARSCTRPNRLGLRHYRVVERAVRRAAAALDRSVAAEARERGGHAAGAGPERCHWAAAGRRVLSESAAAEAALMASAVRHCALRH